MSDHHLRNLERTYHRTGDIADRNAWEAALVRTAHPSRLELYARLLAAIRHRYALAFAIYTWQRELYEHTVRPPSPWDMYLATASPDAARNIARMLGVPLEDLIEDGRVVMVDAEVGPT